MKLYLASSIAYMNELAKPLMAKLREEGVTITHDWTADAQANPGAERELDEKTAYRLAQADLDGIRFADVFWFVVPPIGGAGCFFEFGYFVAKRNSMTWDQYRRSTIFVSGPKRTIFQGLVREDRRFAEHPAALAEILAWGRKKGLL